MFPWDGSDRSPSAPPDTVDSSLGHRSPSITRSATSSKVASVLASSGLGLDPHTKDVDRRAVKSRTRVQVVRGLHG